jgi:hypothetical protein
MVSVAIAGAVGENLGYYGCVAVREVRDHGARATVPAMLIEFGPAKLVDSLLARPLLMYLMPGQHYLALPRSEEG